MSKSLPGIVRKAVDLKLDPPQDAKQRTTMWLKLMEEESSLGYASDYIREELVAATPADLRDYAVQEIRRRLKPDQPDVDLLLAIKRLDGKLTPQEEKTISEHAFRTSFD